ncbi:hypothetical protein Adu01nite_81380 [Paractinoplanes durhamensis]|uniref:Uncharacterized protein n=1 Tax=Paractinoplanes durhamensis TaxID=113563 RepID=A0ABQ3ZAC1_9ACTN|nr:hypothetical protein [Actinoplanes durhamensis]GIE06788.1 hypothetical protein Adu01nite_81380 [Actinoplanes durhamensis]
MIRRCLLVLVAIGLVLGWGTPASAHAGGLVATDARSRVVSLTPPVPGLSVTAVEGGAKLRLVNGTGVAVTAAGTTVAPGDSLTWAEPLSSPAGRRAAGDWSLTVDAGGTPVTVRGVFDWTAPPPFLPWWALTLLLAVAVPLLCRRVHRADLVLAGIGLGAMAASLAHVIGSSLAVTSAPFAGTFVNATGINLLAWPLIAGGFVAVVRGKPAGLLAVCAGAALTAVFVLPDVTAFHRSVLPFAGPAVLERLLVVVALGGGAGAAVAGAAVLRTLAARQEAA